MRSPSRAGSPRQPREYLYQGIAARPFRRAEYVQVKQASLQDGLLIIDLVREVPEAMEGRFGWPKVELCETDTTLTVSAELPVMKPSLHEISPK
jgi:HSP20 family molecular chaperone IbpA